MAEVFLRRLTRWQAEAQREAVADLYVEAYRGPSGEEFRGRGPFCSGSRSTSSAPASRW
ncbi:hypothetical protein OEIGOIKO_02681 [Streptomyces chrestomyceticus JCM 4735]|uniref:Uncharacterized protein n=1 Tax=Streptomyces chrestomyceticus JCM 4735 TaxID=1306181 RepID=A0A7U9KVT6_9ACTN|nr:hypothetical protein [Streptomyces chrestomyceticus]GCD34941.1 hypothetical protein OEIGOIKO_02681 [Streptomyces chrestomyceticus JCM 4735]